MSAVTVRYYQEPEGWWAETDAIPTFSAAGASYAEVHARVLSSLPDLLDRTVEIYEDLTAVGAVVPIIYGAIPASVPGISMHSWLSGRGTSITRGPVSSGVGTFKPEASVLNSKRGEFA